MERFMLESGSQGVTSFKGRTGAVQPQSGDYDVSQVGAEPAGVALALVSAHAQAPDPHPTYLSRSEVGRPGGVAALGPLGRLPLAQLSIEALTSNQLGVPHGVAQLDADGKMRSDQLPTLPGAGVSSFKGRSGNVTPQPGDYSPQLVGAEPLGAVQSALQTHSADDDAHPQYLTRSQADGLYIPAGTTGLGASGASWFQLSGCPRSVVANEEVYLAHSNVSNALAIPIVWLRQASAQDVTRMLARFDLTDSGLYIEQDASKTRVDGAARLQQRDPGGVMACNFETSVDSVYGQVGTPLGNSAVSIAGGIALSGGGFITWSDFPDLTLSDLNWCMELLLTLTALPGGRTGLLFQTDGGGYRAKWFWYLLPISSTQCLFGCHVNGPGYPTLEFTSDPFTVSLGQPLHFVFQRNSNLLQWFVNGQLITLGGAPGLEYGANLWPDCSANLYLGANGDHIQTFLQATVHRMRLRVGAFQAYQAGYTVPSQPFVGPEYDTSATGWWLRTGTPLRLDLSMVERLDYLTAQVTEPLGTSIRFLVSFDAGTSWLSDVGNGWNPVAPSQAQSVGMSATQLTTATTQLDVSELPSLDVLISLKTTDANVTPSLSMLQVRYDEKASYSPALIGPYASGAQFGCKHWSRVTAFKNQTGARQTIIANLLRQGA